MILHLPALAIPLIILAIGGGIVLYARWQAAHDRAKFAPTEKQNRRPGVDWGAN